ncbi:hypothetical protein [uncultured Aquimarina sp.]|uniref:hypothetical protein n=1 Tax=uncultured Aquimarina sp. TaxID=575652 RepID=UPI00261823E7|nr:hypothetical protein [uncultured Aquimarina sp.]
MKTVLVNYIYFVMVFMLFSCSIEDKNATSVTILDQEKLQKQLSSKILDNSEFTELVRNMSTNIATDPNADIHKELSTLMNLVEMFKTKYPEAKHLTEENYLLSIAKSVDSIRDEVFAKYPQQKGASFCTGWPYFCCSLISVSINHVRNCFWVNCGTGTNGC